MEERVALLLEFKRSKMIQEWKMKNPGEVSSEKMFAGLFDTYMSVYGSYVITDIKEEFGISQEQATQMFRRAKANIYDKYNK